MTMANNGDDRTEPETPLAPNQVLLEILETSKQTSKDVTRIKLDLKAVRAEQADMSAALITLEAQGRILVRDTIPNHEQKMRELESQIKAERDARRRDRLQLKDLKEDVEEVTGKTEALTGDRLAKAEEQLKTLDNRRFEWRKLLVGAAITFAILSPWAAFLTYILRKG